MNSKYFIAGFLTAVLFCLVCVPFVFFADYNRVTIALFFACFCLCVVFPVFLYCEENGLLDEDEADK